MVVAARGDCGAGGATLRRVRTRTGRCVACLVSLEAGNAVRLVSPDWAESVPIGDHRRMRIRGATELTEADRAQRGSTQ